MTSTGNDIVARALIDSGRSNEPRFYRKIIAPKEQDFFQQVAEQWLSFEAFLWLCWSVKESAYKYWKRHHHALVFSPARINITAMEKCKGAIFPLRDEYTGTCVLEKAQLQFRTIVHPEYIASLVGNNLAGTKIFWGIRKIGSAGQPEQSDEVRRLLFERLESLWPAKKLRVYQSEQGYPVLMDGLVPLDLPVSFSHHGQFVSCCFTEPATA